MPKRNRSWRTVVLLSIFAAVLSWACADKALSYTTYDACKIPPQISVGFMPNVLLVMDYSGSMQEPAYTDMGSLNWGYGDTSKVFYFGASGELTTMDEIWSSRYYELWQLTLTGTTTVNLSLSGSWRNDDYLAILDSTMAVKYSATGRPAQLTKTLAAGTYYIRVAPNTASTSSYYQGTYMLQTNVNIAPATPATGLAPAAAAVTGTMGSGAVYDHGTYYFGLFNSDQKSGPGGTRDPSKDTYYKYDATGGFFYDTGTGAPDGGNPGDIGTFSKGISGNVLNWIVTTRIDAALKALIGGKASGKDASNNDCDCSDTTDGYCYLMAQGARRGVTETSALEAQFYVRPSVWSATDAYSETWNSPDSAMKYPFIGTVLSSNGIYQGTLSSADTLETDASNKKRYYELWTFTLTQPTTVLLNLSENWSGNGYLAILDSTKTNVLDSATGSPVRLSHRNLAAGTYYVKVCPDTYSSSAVTGTYALSSNVELSAAVTGTGDINKSVGVLQNARVRVRINKNVRTQEAGIYKNWSRANWGFMYYKGDSNNHKGKLMVRCGGASSFDEFAKYLEGKLAPGGTTATTDGEPFPYYGTPTGEAMHEAMNYFKQSGSTINSSLFNKGGKEDPYYALNVEGKPVPVTCRSQYVILVSDGVWNGDDATWKDPVKAAYQMHSPNPTYDLRDDAGLPGQQSADVFTVFAFAPKTSSDYTTGTRSLKWTAMYGGFIDLSGCNNYYPYPQSGASIDSLNDTFPPATGNCGTSAAQTCCKEWTNGADASRLGWPDNYYEASSGDELLEAMSKILGKVTQTTASSSAVATVSQQTGEGDLIVRAMFEGVPGSGDTVNTGKYLWYGHMEAYWPYDDGTYAFEQDTKHVMCKDKTGFSPKNCWDAATPTSLGGTFPSGSTVTEPSGTLPLTSLANTTRRIFTVKGFDTAVPRTMYWFNTTNISAAGDSNGDLGLGLTSTTNPTATNYKDLVKWVQGVDSFTTSTLRTRKDATGNNVWVFGDVVYSTPVVVGPPTLGATARNTQVVINKKLINAVYKTDDATAVGFDKFFLNWRQIPKLKYRDKVIYVGGNDGMLHAFLMAKWYPANDPNGKYITKYGTSIDVSSSNPSDWTHPDVGKEIWAYIPSNLLTELKTLASPDYAKQTGSDCVHRFLVDLAPRAFEVVFQGGATSETSTTPKNVNNTMTLSSDINLPNAIDNWPWHTVLIGGERGGGDMYFALDVTDPYNPKVLWEYSVLKNLVSKFDFKAATPAFFQACFDGTVFSPSNVTGTDCLGPKFDNSLWQGQCNKCACQDSGCTTIKTDSSECESLLKQALNTDAVWKPFLNPAAYNSAKKLPVSWSRPYVGRVGFSSGLQFNPCDPKRGTGGVCTPDCSGSDVSSLPGGRSIAFIGGGLRLYDPSISLFDSTWPQFYQDGFAAALTDTFMLGLDLETGVNVFRYVWPEIFRAARDAGYLKTQFRECTSGAMQSSVNCRYRIPYAMSDPVVIDAWDRVHSLVGEDGFADVVYVADMNGVLYGIKMNFDPLSSVTANETGFYVDLWKTKPIPLNTQTGGTLDYATNLLRSRLQPVTTQPSVSIDRESAAVFETDGKQGLRIIIAGGKHDDVTGDATDATDVAKMSLFNLRDSIGIPTKTTFTGTYLKTGTVGSTSPGLFWAVRSNCEQPSSGTSWDKETQNDERYRCKGQGTESDCIYSVNKEAADKTVTGTENWSGCTWMRLDSSSVAACSGPTCSDCCEGAKDTPCPTGACWRCVYDLQDKGEKVINKPLIAGGIVFVTTFSPLKQADDPCMAGGRSYLYAFDYMCQPFPDGFRPFPDIISYTIKANTTGSQILGQKADLGLGVASQPVLDSTGNSLIIQNSQGQITRVQVNLLSPVASLKGWKERDTGCPTCK
jgi:type IV pilus assembly protein PilY1